MSFLHNVLLCRPFCVQVAEFFCGCLAVAFRYLILGPSELKTSLGIWNIPLVNIAPFETKGRNRDFNVGNSEHRKPDPINGGKNTVDKIYQNLLEGT